MASTVQRALTDWLAVVRPVDFLGIHFPEADRIRKELQAARPSSMTYARLENRLKTLRIRNDQVQVTVIDSLLAVGADARFFVKLIGQTWHVFDARTWLTSPEVADELQTFLGEAAIRMGAPVSAPGHYKFTRSLLRQLRSVNARAVPDAEALRLADDVRTVRESNVLAFIHENGFVPDADRVRGGLPLDDLHQLYVVDAVARGRQAVGKQSMARALRSAGVQITHRHYGRAVLLTR